MRAVRCLTAAVACLVTLVWIGGASALIVPQHSIAGVELNMTRPEVKDKKGDPDRIVHGTNDFGPYTQFTYKKAVGKLMVTFQGNAGATAVWTNRETQKTAEGVHVGSPESALHDAYPRLHCRTESSAFRHHSRSAPMMTCSASAPTGSHATRIAHPVRMFSIVR